MKFLGVKVHCMKCLAFKEHNGILPNWPLKDDKWEIIQSISYGIALYTISVIYFFSLGVK